MVTIAVVIPTHNRGAALLRALGSVARQTRPPDELIVVDDASHPPVTEVLAGEPETVGAVPMLRVVVNPERRGAAFSRNRGVAASASELIAFLDSDDYWAPEKLECQAALFAARPELDLVYCDQHIVDPGGRRRPSGKTLISDDLLPHLLAFWTAPNTSTLMIRRASFLGLGGFDETLSSCQDHDLWMRIATRGLLVDCVRAPLSCFCFDQQERISSDPAARLAGIEGFLAKWRPTIDASGGSAAFHRFRNRYYVAAAVPLFVAALKAGRPAAWPLFARYLATNPELYRKLWRRLLRRRDAAPARIAGSPERP